MQPKKWVLAANHNQEILMNKLVSIGVIAVVIVGGGGFLLLHKSSTKSNKSSTASTMSTSQMQQMNSSAASSAGTTSGNTMAVTVTANDESATPETITAKAGQTVKLTFNVSSKGTYHGGLDFKSIDPAIDSGSIDEGSSKTITFTATKSFKFTPYWYKSNVQKDYFVTVNVN
jgi:plastocyanin